MCDAPLPNSDDPFPFRHQNRLSNCQYKRIYHMQHYVYASTDILCLGYKLYRVSGDECSL